jgi:NitT/TauT family transport system permease protein
MKFVSAVFIRIAIPLIVLLILWEGIIVLFDLSPVTLPSAADVFKRLISSANLIYINLLVSAEALLLGLASSIVIGVLLAIFVQKSVWFSISFEPLIIGSQVVPKVALIPLILEWAGQGTMSKLWAVILLSFFPVFEGVRAGLRSVDQEYLLQMDLLGVRGIRRLLNCDLLFAMPHFFVGLKTSTLLAVIGVIVAEFLASGDGIGYLITNRIGKSQMDGAFACIVAVSILGFALYYLVQLLEHLALRRLRLNVDRRAV